MNWKKFTQCKLFFGLNNKLVVDKNSNNYIKDDNKEHK